MSTRVTDGSPRLVFVTNLKLRNCYIWSNFITLCQIGGKAIKLQPCAWSTDASSRPAWPMGHHCALDLNWSLTSGQYIKQCTWHCREIMHKLTNELYHLLTFALNIKSSEKFVELWCNLCGTVCTLLRGGMYCIRGRRGRTLYNPANTSWLEPVYGHSPQRCIRKFSPRDVSRNPSPQCDKYWQC